MQQGLVQWQSFLVDKPLPVLQRTKIDVQNLISQAQLSITQYAAPVLFDAAFSAYIFRYVNTQRVSAGKNPLTTMSNALSHLGQSAFEALLNKARIFEKLDLAEKNKQGYMRVMGQACHGLYQATDWAQQRETTQAEETQLAALLQTITELMLWCYAGDVMPKIENCCYGEKQTYEEAANKVLGCGMRELGAALAEVWQLPEMAVDGLNTRQDNFTLATGVSLASELARIVAINWYGKDAVDIIRKISRYKGRAEGEIEHRLHLNAVNISDVLIGKGYESPAKLLPQLADDSYIDVSFVLQTQAEKAELSETIEKKKAPTINRELAIAIKEFKLMVAQAKPAHDLIEQAVKACLLCGVQRSVFMVKIPDKKILVARYFEQISEDIKINNLKIPMDKPHVFTLLMEKNRNLFLNDSNRNKYWNYIPDNVKLSTGVKQFFAMPVFAGNQAMGLMYADKIKGDLSQTEFEQCQAVCRLLSKGILQSARNKKNIKK